MRSLQKKSTKKFLRSFHLAKKKNFYGELSRLSVSLLYVNNNRFEKSNTQDSCAIYALSYSLNFNFCTASLMGLPSWNSLILFP